MPGLLKQSIFVVLHEGERYFGIAAAEIIYEEYVHPGEKRDFCSIRILWSLTE